MITQITECDAYSWRRPRSESSADAESMYMTNPVLSDSGFAQQSRRSSVSFTFSSYDDSCCEFGRYCKLFLIPSFLIFYRRQQRVVLLVRIENAMVASRNGA